MDEEGRRRSKQEWLGWSISHTPTPTEFSYAIALEHEALNLRIYLTRLSHTLQKADSYLLHLLMKVGKGIKYWDWSTRPDKR